jgi:aminoglycoside 6'-N-acetyltransferase I
LPRRAPDRGKPIAGARFMELPFRSLRDLTPTPGIVEQTARLLFDAFRDHAAAWPTLESARQEVLDSLTPDRISRVMVDDAGTVMGWIGGIPAYDGLVWEVHPIVVSTAHRRHGVGRALIEDLERLAAARGVLTLWVGSDDELDQTTMGGADLYGDIPEAMRSIRNLRDHPYEFFLRVGFEIAGVLPDANGRGKPDIFLAKRVSAS